MKNNNLFIALTTLILALFISSSCQSESDYDKQVKIDNEILAEFVKDLTPAPTKHSTGFYYQVIELNEGGQQLKKDDVVSLRYNIYNLNGELIEGNYYSFDVSSTKSDEDEMFPVALLKLKTQTVIPEALDNCVALMNLGDKYRFIIPSYLAYGSYSTSYFKAHSNFIIDVEVVDVQSEDDIIMDQNLQISAYLSENYDDYEITSSGLVFIDSEPGTGRYPENYSIVLASIERRYLDNTLNFKDNNAELQLDRGLNASGLEEGVKMIKEGGSAILIMASDIAFGQSACIIPQKTRTNLYNDRILLHNVEPYSILKYSVTLKDFTY